jgi:CRISPR-associated protein Cas2
MLRKRYVITYDIVDNKQRNKVANTIKNYGVRVQKSVFECHIASDTLQKLLDKLEKLIDPEKDSILVYQQCKDCFAHRTGMGTFISNEEKDFKIV